MHGFVWLGKRGESWRTWGRGQLHFSYSMEKNLISIKVWKIPLNILHTQLLLCTTESSSSKKPLNHSGLKSTLKEVSFYMARSTLALFTEVSVMRILLQLMTFKRLDYVGEWPLGFPEKASGLPSSLSLSLVPTLHTLRFDLLFLFCEFPPAVKNNIKSFWRYL